MKVHSLPSPSPCAARGWGEQRGRRRCRGSRGRRGRTTAPVVPHGGGPGAGAAKPRRPVGPSPPLPALRRPPASSCGPGRSRRARRRRCSAAASRRSGVPARRSARRRGCGARDGRTAGSRPPLPVPGPGAAPAAARGGCSGPDRGSRLLALPWGPRPGRRLSDPAGRDDLPAGARRSTDGQGGGGGPRAALRVRPAVLGRFCSPRSFRRPRLRVAVGAARAPPARGREEPPSASSGEAERWSPARSRRAAAPAPRGPGAVPPPAPGLRGRPRAAARRGHALPHRLQPLADRPQLPQPHPPPPPAYLAAGPAGPGSRASHPGRPHRHLQPGGGHHHSLHQNPALLPVLGRLLGECGAEAARGGGCAAPRGPSPPPVPGEGSPAAPPPSARACRGALWENPKGSPRVTL